MRFGLAKWRITSGAALLCALAACGGGPSDPPDHSGVVSVSLEGALADDGAVLLAVTAGASAPVAARGDLQLHSRVQSGALTIAVFGPLAGGDLFTVSVADTTAVPVITVLDVSANDGELRPSVTGYTARSVVR